MSTRLPTELRDRYIANLSRDLSALIPYMIDDLVSDIYINQDGKLWIRKQGVGRVFTELILPPGDVRRIILSSASMVDKFIDADNPSLASIIPSFKVEASRIKSPFPDYVKVEGGHITVPACRLQAYIEPRCMAPSLIIRRPTTKTFTLADYVINKRMPEKYNEILYKAVVDHKNILIGGGTGTGKTTFLNALINECSVHCPSDRLLIIEDTAEIKCASEDYLSMEVRPEKTIDALRDALRSNPDRIIFGELRYGDSALETIKGWQTGHEGGFATIHSNSATRMLPRLVDLISEILPGNVHLGTIADTINYCVFLKSTPGFGPVVSELLEVSPDVVGGEFKFRSL